MTKQPLSVVKTLPEQNAGILFHRHGRWWDPPPCFYQTWQIYTGCLNCLLLFLGWRDKETAMNWGNLAQRWAVSRREHCESTLRWNRRHRPHCDTHRAMWGQQQDCCLFVTLGRGLQEKHRELTGCMRNSSPRPKGALETHWLCDYTCLEAKRWQHI